MSDETKPDLLDDASASEAASYYFMEFWCWNCGKRNGKYIRKGLAVNHVRFDCWNCDLPISGKKDWVSPW